MTRSDPLAFLKRHKEPPGKTLIKVPSETRYIRKVSSGILSGLARYDVDESRLFDIRLCVEEAVRNAMVHGNHCDKVSTQVGIEEYSRAYDDGSRCMPNSTYDGVGRSPHLT